LKRALAPLALLLSALTATLFPRPAEACAPAPPPGVFVQIAEESAIIVWDDKAHVEHFVRRASFRTAARDFGFLVPTPGKPELAEMSDAVFTQLEQATRPPVVHATKVSGVEPTLLCGFFFLLRGASAPEAAAPASPVRVLDAQRIAGYDAVVLEADDARELARWLKEHGYAERPALSDWLAPYVAMRWKLTAFKIAPKEEGAREVATSAVRMTFSTDRPLFPYREPADQRENLPANLPEAHGERLLRIFFFGPERVGGAIGGQAAAWPGKAIWSNHLDPAKAGSLPAPIPAGAWLTVFEDKASPRPGTEDLFFTRSADQQPIVPPPVVWTTYTRVPLPLDLIGGVGLVVWLLWRKAKRAKKQEAGP